MKLILTFLSWSMVGIPLAAQSPPETRATEGDRVARQALLKTTALAISKALRFFAAAQPNAGRTERPPFPFTAGCSPR